MKTKRHTVSNRRNMVGGLYCEKYQYLINPDTFLKFAQKKKIITSTRVQSSEVTLVGYGVVCVTNISGKIRNIFNAKGRLESWAFFRYDGKLYIARGKYPSTISGLSTSTKTVDIQQHNMSKNTHGVLIFIPKEIISLSAISVPPGPPLDSSVQIYKPIEKQIAIKAAAARYQQSNGGTFEDAMKYAAAAAAAAAAAEDAAAAVAAADAAAAEDSAAAEDAAAAAAAEDSAAAEDAAAVAAPAPAADAAAADAAADAADEQPEAAVAAALLTSRLSEFKCPSCTDISTYSARDETTSDIYNFSICDSEHPFTPMFTSANTSESHFGNPILTRPKKEPITTTTNNNINNILKEIIIKKSNEQRLSNFFNDLPAVEYPKVTIEELERNFKFMDDMLYNHGMSGIDTPLTKLLKNREMVTITQ